MDNNLTMADGTVLDPKVLKVTRAIRQIESGGDYKAVGDNGTSHGAYQWQPGNFESAATSFGLNPNDRSPANQNKVAYLQVKAYKDEGLQPEEIAARWNGAHKDPTGKYTYNNPEYGTRFRAALSGKPTSTATPSVSQETPIMPPEAQPTPDLLQQVGNVVNTIFPGKEVGESIGTLAGFIAAKIHDAIHGTNVADYYDTSAPTPLQTVADVGAGALMVGGIPGVAAPATAAGRIGMAGLETGAFGALNTVAGGSTDAGEIARNAAISGTLGAATGGLFEGGSALLGKIGGKSAEEILATAEKDVSKLSPKERNFWYKNQAEATSKTASELISKAKAAGEASVAAATKEIQDFNTKIGKASTEETMALKKPAQQVIKDGYDEYERLTGEAAGGSDALQKTLTHEEIAAKADSKFENDPQLAQAFKKDFGIKETPVPETSLFAAADVAKLKPEIKITNQELLDKARALMQTVRASARGGTQVYTAAEAQAMQEYSFAMQLLGENGVDMTAANNFYRKFAPVRNRILKEIKPFDESGIQSMPFAKTVQKANTAVSTAAQAASKLDAENFVAELERRMKLEPGTIGADTKEAITGLEKAKLNKEAAAQITKDTLAQIRADKAAALKTISLKQYNTERIARRNSIIKKVILTALGLGALSRVPAVHTAATMIGL